MSENLWSELGEQLPQFSTDCSEIWCFWSASGWMFLAYFSCSSDHSLQSYVVPMGGWVRCECACELSKGVISPSAIALFAGKRKWRLTCNLLYLFTPLSTYFLMICQSSVCSDVQEKKIHNQYCQNYAVSFLFQTFLPKFPENDNEEKRDTLRFGHHKFS